MSTNSSKVSRGRVIQVRAWEQEQVVDTEKKDIMVPMDLTADELHQVLDVVIESTGAEARAALEELLTTAYRIRTQPEAESS